MKTLRNKSLLLITISLLFICSSWGFLMHRTINQLSVYQLPKKMKPFFYENLEYLVKNSIRPDDRRNTDTTEATKHFIDLEAYGTDAAITMPMHWDEAVRKYTKDSLLKYGYVPYWIIEMKNRLTTAFKKQERDSILFYAADLGHYIADANVPLHTTMNYDGQLTNQRGLHALWESVVPELTIEEFNLYGQKKAHYLKHPEESIWTAVRKAYSLVPGVIEAEREVTKTFTEATKYRIQNRNGKDVKYYTRDFALAYAKKLQPTINEQAINAANLVADFWYTAWHDAGKPDLQNLLKKPWNDTGKDSLKAEIKGYRKNTLLKNKWLVARKDVVRDPAGN